jgi:hypothetical protein
MGLCCREGKYVLQSPVQQTVYINLQQTLESISTPGTTKDGIVININKCGAR